MSPELLLNAAWGVTLWAAACAAAVLAMCRCPAAFRRGACRLALIGAPVVLLGAVVVHRESPSSGLFLRRAAPVVETPRAARGTSDVDLSAGTAPTAPAVPEAQQGETLPEAVLAVPEPASTPSAPAPVSAALRGEVGVPAADWSLLLPAGVLLIGGAWAGVLAYRLLRLARWRRSWRKAPPAWGSLTRRLARRIGMDRPFSVFVAPGLSQPAASGLLRGAIILPDRSPGSLGPGLRSALAHELGHLDGRDPLWYLLGQSVIALTWWCPIIWWLEWRGRVESELAADDHALASGVRPIDLVKTLARFAEGNLQTTPAGISGMTCHLRRRIEMIMNAKQPHRSRLGGRPWWLLALGACLVGLAILSTPLVGVVQAADDDDGLSRPPVVRKVEAREREGRGDREEGKRAEPRREREEPERGRREVESRERRRERGDGEGEGERRFRMPRELHQMIEAAKITDAQEKAIKEQLQAKEDTLRAWRKDNAAKLRDAEDALRKAQQALGRLREAQADVARAADAKVMAVFTPKQRATWETTKIAKMYNRPRGENPMVLTDRQLDDVDVLCEKAGKELIAAESKPKAEADRAKREILFALQKKIYQDVLTDDQRRRAPRPRGLREREEGEGRERRERGREVRREPREERGEGVRRERGERGGEREGRRESREKDEKEDAPRRGEGREGRAER